MKNININGIVRKLPIQKCMGKISVQSNCTGKVETRRKPSGIPRQQSETVQVSTHKCCINLGKIQFEQFLVKYNVIVYHRSSTHISRNVFQQIRRNRTLKMKFQRKLIQKEIVIERYSIATIANDFLKSWPTISE